ncbi:tudor and KH domain-containing protein homolog [Ornithodoros turicata]|uniref:tudor and KH domain-containing protein homolog n=1 Tax=Ornithodoros turicata TaxID=34597 RepID=UPI003138C4CC
MDSRAKTIALWAGLGLGVTVSTALLYLLLKQEEEYEVRRKKVETVKHNVAKVKVPKEVIGALIGRQGANIKAIQEKTNTKINFEHQGSGEEGDRIAIIRGTSIDVQEAENLIAEFIKDQSNVTTETVFVPVKACGRIIGKNGENIRHMCRTSRAQIKVDRSGDEHDPNSLKCVHISGTKDQIRVAITMIDEKLAEEEAFQQRVALSSAGRAALYRGRPMAIKAASTEAKDGSQQQYPQEELTATAKDGFIEVYVSALESPHRFWVQLVGTKSIALDKLVTDMTTCYSQEQQRDATSIAKAAVGDIIAARFMQDDSWYRARITAVNESDYSADETQVAVHYVDFGETGTFKLKEVCKLLEEYHELPYQAIECCLSGVELKEGNRWTAEACDLFESLSYAGLWKVVMAKPVGRVKREESAPGFAYLVELVDTNGSEDINVGKELVKQGFALHKT